LTVNPALHAGKILKRPKTLAEGELEIFAMEEERAFLATVKTHYPVFYPMALTFFRTGMRAGEVMGLHREDLDFRGRVILIRRNWSRGRLGTPKNGKSRKVDMSQALAAALHDHLTLLDLEAMATRHHDSGSPVPGAIWAGLGGSLRTWLRTTCATNCGFPCSRRHRCDD
jgi:integrase